MTSATPPAQNQLNSAANTSTSARSYANAATKISQTDSSTAQKSSAAGQQQQQNGKPSSSVNNKPATSSAAAMSNGPHGRKQSVVISASGTTGSIPNGGPVGGQSPRPNISFGSMNGPQSSPAIASSGPYNAQNSLATPNNPRIISPSHSPSPIPQPAVSSGGRPPTNLPGQSNGLSFGSLGAENDDSTTRGGPLTPNVGPAHLRRESSQSGHGDMGNVGMGRGFNPSGRGRGNFMPGGNYGASHSPAQAYRQLPNQHQHQHQHRGPGNMGPSYQGQMGGSPYRGRNSPAMMHAQPYMSPGMQSPQMHYGGHPQHLNPQQQVSLPRTFVFDSLLTNCPGVLRLPAHLRSLQRLLPTILPARPAPSRRTAQPSSRTALPCRLPGSSCTHGQHFPPWCHVAQRLAIV